VRKRRIRLDWLAFETVETQGMSEQRQILDLTRRSNDLLFLTVWS